MGKLGKTFQKTVDEKRQNGEAVPSAGGPMPVGFYRVKLKDVGTSDKTRNGDPMWNWQFEVVAPAKYNGRKLSERTALTDAALWKVAQIFEAFDVPSSTDTDALLSKELVVDVDQQPSRQDPNRVFNNIRSFYPADTELDDDSTVETVSGDSTEPAF